MTTVQARNSHIHTRLTLEVTTATKTNSHTFTQDSRGNLPHQHAKRPHIAGLGEDLARETLVRKPSDREVERPFECVDPRARVDLLGL